MSQSIIRFYARYRRTLTAIAAYSVSGSSVTPAYSVHNKFITACEPPVTGSAVLDHHRVRGHHRAGHDPPPGHDRGVHTGLGAVRDDTAEPFFPGVHQRARTKDMHCAATQVANGRTEERPEPHISPDHRVPDETEVRDFGPGQQQAAPDFGAGAYIGIR